MKKISYLLGLAATVLVLSGCVQREADDKAIANRDGSILTFDKTNARDGFYVMKSNGDMNPLLMSGVRNDGTSSYVIYSDFDQLIPTLHKNKKNHIAMVSSSASPKTEYRILKLKDYGYTIGINFEVPADTSEVDTGEDVLYDDRVRFGTRINNYSPIKGYLNERLGVTDFSGLWVDSINNEKITPSMVTPMGYVKGLQKKTMYFLGIYSGTKYHKVDVQSDSRLFEETGESYTADVVRVKKDTYFTLELPEDMEPGYYLIENAGVFKYEG